MTFNIELVVPQDREFEVVFREYFHPLFQDDSFGSGAHCFLGRDDLIELVPLIHSGTLGQRDSRTRKRQEPHHIKAVRLP